MLRTTTAAALATGLVAGFAAAPALAQSQAEAATDSGVEIGTLTCEVQDVDNILVYTEQDFACTFDPAGDAAGESYVGEITKVGVDLSIKQDFTIVWAVVAPTEDAYEPKALAGTYAGAGADVALGAGVGAKVLVGGGDNSFTLQPVSVTGVEGIGASLGVERFELR